MNVRKTLVDMSGFDVISRQKVLCTNQPTNAHSTFTVTALLISLLRSDRELL